MCSISPVPPAVQGREEGDSTGPSVGAAPVSIRPLAIGTAAVAQLCALNLTREEALDWQISNRLFPCGIGTRTRRQALVWRIVWDTCRKGKRPSAKQAGAQIPALDSYHLNLCNLFNSLRLTFLIREMKDDTYTKEVKMVKHNSVIKQVDWVAECI